MRERRRQDGKEQTRGEIESKKEKMKVDIAIKSRQENENLKAGETWNDKSEHETRPDE